ncbi:MAG TPA: hypothetical protein PKD85_16875 [Saprospiraceae bacterium]|nr:hypothetical protein [Saprospiraceae bacterium]
MDKLKITISGIVEVTVKNITIGTVIKRKVNSKFRYDENDNYIGIIEHKNDSGNNYDLFIDLSSSEIATGKECSCNIFNETKNRDYGTKKSKLSQSGGVNFVFDIY